MPKNILRLPTKSRLRPLFAALLTGLVAACSSPQRQAPIVDHSAAPVVTAGSAQAPAPIVTAGSSSAYSGPPRSYVVRKGDTLYKIAVEHGKDYREIASLNQLDSTYRISVGQTLKIDAPDSAASMSGGSAIATPVVIGAPLENRPLGAQSNNGAKSDAKPTGADAGKPGAAGSDAVPADAGKRDAAKPDAPKPAAEPAKPEARSDDGAINWAWPASGRVLDGFDDSRNKGLDIGGAIGDPVLAAGDGKVVYAGNGLRGYGQLLIVKHNDNYLSAYAHNSKLIAKYGDSVKRGQKIAELGNSDSDKPKLHFEIRRQGKPVDPAKFLPAR